MISSNLQVYRDDVVSARGLSDEENATLHCRYVKHATLLRGISGVHCISQSLSRRRPLCKFASQPSNAWQRAAFHSTALPPTTARPMARLKIFNGDTSYSNPLHLCAYLPNLERRSSMFGARSRESPVELSAGGKSVMNGSSQIWVCAHRCVLFLTDRPRLE